MALPSSGALALSDIQTEFGGSNPASLSEYYAGGAYVPAGTTGTYGAVPTSGAISIRNFYGTSNTVITLSNQTIYDADGVAAYAWYFVTSGGQIEQAKTSDGSNPTNLEQWCTPTNTAADFEVRVTVNFGFLSGGSATGTWLAISGGTRNWYLANTSSGTLDEVQFTVEIRRVGTTTVLDSATITLQAEVF